MKKTKFIAVALAVLFFFNTYAVPRSKAVVIDATAAFGAAAATAAINGTTATTLFTGMTTSAATSAMTGLMGEYAVATGAASSGTALAASIGAGTVITAAGAIVLTAAAAFAVYKFIEWLRTDRGVEAGRTVNFSYSDYYIDTTVGRLGLPYYFLGPWTDAVYDSSFPVFEIPQTFFIDESSFFGVTVDSSNSTYFIKYQLPDGFTHSVDGSIETYGSYVQFFAYNTSLNQGPFLAVALFKSSPSSGDSPTIGYNLGKLSSYTSDFHTSVDFSLAGNLQQSFIPSEIPDGQAMVISGIENLPQADPQAAADFIMQSAIDGNLSPSVTVEADPTVTPDPDPDPDPEPVPPSGDLPQNLPELGDVLISRFPFSIPWDIGRVLDFLSAEPVAPHINFQPFKGDLFGIPADSVSVDYDFSKHEDIAAFCRTFEIVGFCLLLAVGTKRLIWTA